MKCAGFKNIINKSLQNYPKLNIEKIISYKKQYKNLFLLLIMKNPKGFKDYKILKKIFKDNLKIIKPDNIQQPSTKVAEGIKDILLLKSY